MFLFYWLQLFSKLQECAITPVNLLLLNYISNITLGVQTKEACRERGGREGGEKKKTNGQITEHLDVPLLPKVVSKKDILPSDDL